MNFELKMQESTYLALWNGSILDSINSAIAKGIEQPISLRYTNYYYSIYYFHNG